MLALLTVLATCALVEPEPGYTIHIRELTAPERVVRMPLAGDESVLDAVSRLRRTAADLAKMDFWIVRPGPTGGPQVYRVDWIGISERGQTRTNFMLHSGDRLFLQERFTE